ncbi:MAG: LuxR family transcriptional regulator [Pseudomonadota bacterium]
MILEDAFTAIEAADTTDVLLQTLQSIAESYGFSCCGFTDTSRAGDVNPFFIGTHDQAFVETYLDEGFTACDPILALTRRSNLPFNWSSLPLVLPKKSGAYKTMTTAWDFGILDGVTIPFHYNDRLGRRYSSNCTFFWKNKAAALRKLFTFKRYELHMVVLYWAQKVIDLEAVNRKLKPVFAKQSGDASIEVTLTNREKDVLAWAGRGKTVQETADILTIGYDTVETHMRHAMNKLDASTKTHAVVKAVYLGLVDV